jgi:putative membrane protein
MFIDYLTVMLINLVAGLGLLALHLIFFVESAPKRLAPGFLLTGFIGGTTGLHMTLTWPLPGSHNIVFGEMGLLFGALFFFAGLALLSEWDLLGLGLYAIVAGVAVVILGFRILNLGMTRSATVSFLGYLFTGVGAILTLPAYALKKSVPIRVVVGLVLLAAAAIWAITGYGSYWAHPDSFKVWIPGGPPGPPQPAPAS